MKIRVLGAASLMALLCALAAPGCGSEVDEEQGNVLDGVLDIEVPPQDPNEENCNSSNAKSGASCHKDCITGCGFTRAGEKLGIKVCPCSAGVYWECPCFKSVAYQGPEVAPLCPNPGGAAHADGSPCDQEWDACVSTDPVSGSTPRGCLCLESSGGALEWDCGSTNRWFRLEGT